MTEPTSVGEIIAYLRINRDQWRRDVRDTTDDARGLGRLNPNIRITTNAVQVMAQLEAVRAAGNRVADAQDRLSVSRTKLAEAQQRYAAGSSQLQAAESAAAKAARDLDQAQEHLATTTQQAELTERRAAAALNDFSAQATNAGNSADQAHKPIISLAGALALLGPAAIPIGAVAGGALAGLLPTAASVALGIAGISGELKSGALQGTAYGRDINSLTGELSDLKAISAGGLLSGLNQGLASSKPLFREINTDAQIMSTQVGAIAAHAGPALLEFLTQLNPLFVTFGSLLVRGATELEHFAQSSDGVGKFADYVQGELPSVMQLIGNLIVLFGHVVQAGAPLGGVLVGELGLLVRALDALPVGALQVLIPLLVSARIAMLGYRGVSAIVNGISGAYRSTTGAVRSFADRNNVASLQVQAAAARNAAAVGAEAQAIELARLQEAEAAQVAAEQQVVAAQQVSGAATFEARVVLDAKIEEATAARTAATAAISAAAAQSEAAEASAARVLAAGRVAGTGWTAALGPIGALVLGLTFLGSAFLGSSHESTAATQANNAYAESVKQSTDALNKANLSATVDTLSKAGALSQLKQANAEFSDLGLTFGDLTNAVNGSDAQFNKVISTLRTYAAFSKEGSKDSPLTALANTLGTARTSLDGNIAKQKLYNAAQKASISSAENGSAANQRQAAALGLTGAAYLTAQQAAKQNTASTQAQTAAFQAENNAASLLQQALDGLAGNNLSVAQAQTTLGLANASVGKSFKDNGTAIKGNSAAALANQQAIQGQVQAAQSAAEAISKQTGSSDKGVAAFKRSKDALEDQLRAQGKLTPSVQAYIDKLYNLSNLKVPPTKLDADTRAANAKAKALQGDINKIKQGKVPGLTAHNAEGKSVIDQLQDWINGLHQGDEPIIDVNTAVALAKINYLAGQVSGLGATLAASQGSKNANKIGGRATGGGLPEGVSAVGERGAELAIKNGSNVQILSNTQSRAYLAATGLTAPGFANGTTPGFAAGTGKTTAAELSTLGQAAGALLAAARNTYATAQDVRDATSSLKSAARAAHEGAAAIAAAGRIQTAINTAAAKRQALVDRLGSAPAAPTLYERLQDAVSTRSQDASSFAGGITGGFDITQAGTGGGAGTVSKQAGATITTTTPGVSGVSLAALIGNSDSAVAQAKEYDRLLRRLAAEGLDKTELLELAGKSPADGLPVARELAKATPAQIRHLAANQTVISRTGNTLGVVLAQRFDGAGVSLIQGLIRGVQSQEKALDNTIERLADGMIKKFRDKLKIKSPSLVTHEIGAYVGEGLANGMVERLPRVTAAAGQLAGAAVPSVGGSVRGAAAAGGISMPITVHAAPGQSEREVGRAAADEIAWVLHR